MPTRNGVLTGHQNHFVEQRLIEPREHEDELRIAVLRDAAKVGIADIEAGNFRSFDSAEMLGQHLAALTSEVIGV